MAKTNISGICRAGPPHFTTIVALASCARTLRSATGQVASEFTTPMSTDYLRAATVESLKRRNGVPPADQTTAGRITRCIFTIGFALLLGATILMGGAQASGAGTLTFTFNDNGKTTTITPNGSVDLADLTEGGGVSHSDVDLSILSDSYDKTHISNSVRGTITTYRDVDFDVTGKSSYTGSRNYIQPPSYLSTTYLLLEDDFVIVFRDHVTGTVFNPTGQKIKFEDTIANQLKDNNFSITYAFGEETIIFQTKPLVKPTGLIATPGDNQITLNWTNPVNSSIEKYQYQKKTAGGEYGEWEDMDPSDAYTTSYTVDGLGNDREYTFKIRAVKDDGVNAVSDEVSARTVAEGVPLAAELTASPSTLGAILTWTHTGDPSITKWQFQQRASQENFGAEWEDIPVSRAETRRHAVDNLTGGVVHGFRIRAVNSAGVGVPSNEATTTPSSESSVEMEKQVITQSLAAVGQAALSGVTDVIDDRLKSTPGTASLMLGGLSVSTAALSRNTPDDQQMDSWWSGNRSSESFSGPVDNAQMLDGSAFTLSLSEEDAGESNSGWTIWGRGDYRSFEGKTRKDSWDGSVKSAWLGFDTRTNEHILAGLAVSRNRGEINLVADEAGSSVETSLTAAWPYMQMTMPNGTGTVRVVLGIGSGDAEHHFENGDVERAGLSMTAASVGVRWAVSHQGQVTLSIPIKAEVVQLKTDGDGTTAISGLSVRTWRTSGGVEATHSGVALSDSGWILTPRGSLKIRWDGGDGVTGNGIEIGGGFGLRAPDSRLSLDASGNWLAKHSDSNQREWGASIGVQIAPDSDGRGWSASLRQEWGLQQEGLLSGDTLFQNDASGSISPLGSLAARAGYGFRMKDGLMTLSAGALMATGDKEVPRYSAGMEFALPRGLTATLKGEHVGDVDPYTSIGAGVHLSF